MPKKLKKKKKKARKKLKIEKYKRNEKSMKNVECREANGIHKTFGNKIVLDHIIYCMRSTFNTPYLEMRTNGIT